MMKHDYMIIDDTMICNTCFLSDEDIEYANHHRLNIKYKEVHCSSFADDLFKLEQLGYKFEMKSITNTSPDGLELPLKLYALFIHKDNQTHTKSDSTKEIDTFETNLEKKCIIECMNYLLCLSRLVSLSDVKKYYGFRFDEAIIDYIKRVKDELKSGSISKELLNNSLFKEIVEDLNYSNK